MLLLLVSISFGAISFNSGTVGFSCGICANVYVPYTGANQDVNLGVNGITANDMSVGDFLTISDDGTNTNFDLTSGDFVFNSNVNLGDNDLSVGGQTILGIDQPDLGFMTSKVKIVANTTGVSGVQMGNIGTGTGTDFRFILKDSTDHYFAFQQAGISNTQTLWGRPRSSYDAIFNSGGTTRDMIIGTASSDKDLILVAGGLSATNIKLVIDGSTGGNVLMPQDNLALVQGAGDDYSQYFDGTNQNFELTSGIFKFNKGLSVNTGNTITSGWHMGESEEEGMWFTSLLPSQFFISGGSKYDNGLWIAKDTSTQQIVGSSGNVIFRANTGLTAGNSFTPTELVRITSTGNVGIGTNAPTEKLHVIGNAKINGDLDVQNNLTVNGSFNLNTPVEDDLFFPTSVLRVAGATGIPEVTPWTLNFDDTTLEQVYAVYQLPHRRALNTPIEPHFHWQSDTNNLGDVVWCMEYNGANISASFNSMVTKCVVDSSVGNSNVHLMSPEIMINDINFGPSAMGKLRLFRNASDSRDTLVGDANLIQFDIHIYIDKLGEPKLT